MAAPQAAGEIVRMKRVSDTPSPTTAAETAPKRDPTFGSLIEKQPIISGDGSIGSIDQRITNTIATNHEASHRLRIAQDFRECQRRRNNLGYQM